MGPRLGPAGSFMGGADIQTWKTILARGDWRSNIVFTKGELRNNFEVIRRARAETRR